MVKVKKKQSKKSMKYIQQKCSVLRLAGVAVAPSDECDCKFERSSMSILVRDFYQEKFSRRKLTRKSWKKIAALGTQVGLPDWQVKRWARSNQ